MVTDSMHRTSEAVLAGIEAKRRRAFEVTGQRPRYLLLGVADYPVVLGAARIVAGEAFATHDAPTDPDGMEAEVVCGLVVVQAHARQLIEVGW
jgi:hypothetical protein